MSGDRLGHCHSSESSGHCFRSIARSRSFRARSAGRRRGRGLTGGAQADDAARRAEGVLEGYRARSGKECTMLGASRLTRRDIAKLLGAGAGAAAWGGRVGPGVTPVRARPGRTKG